MEQPILIEPGIKYYLSQSLKNCRSLKDYYYNIVFNVGIFIIFVTVIIIVLNFKYKGATSNYEKIKKEEKKKLYILEQIKKMQQLQKNNSMDLITNLPLYKKEF